MIILVIWDELRTCWKNRKSRKRVNPEIALVNINPNAATISPTDAISLPEYTTSATNNASPPVPPSPIAHMAHRGGILSTTSPVSGMARMVMALDGAVDDNVSGHVTGASSITRLRENNQHVLGDGVLAVPPPAYTESCNDVRR